jgi:predicted TPR repeat methyltransferase
MDYRPDSTEPQNLSESGQYCDHQAARLVSALNLHEAGDSEQAGEIYREILASDPDQPEANHNLGLIHHAKGELDEAIKRYRRMLATVPESHEAHYNLANALKETGRVEEAIRSYRNALTIAPEHVGAHLNLGAAYLGKNMLSEAVASYQRVLAFDPHHAEAWYNLGVALQTSGEPDQAIGCYARALTVDPEDVDSYFNLAILLKAKGEVEEAIAAYRAAGELSPNDPDIQFNLGIAYAERDELDEAAACYRRALAIDPNYAPAYANLGGICQRQGRNEEAIDCYRQTLKLGHRVAATSHILAALTGEKSDMAPAEYIRDLFDQYAERFDHSLITELGYQVPTLLRQALDAVLPPETNFRHAVDLGCGTGLSGLPFRSLAQRLNGVDLSKCILVQAREKGIYDALDHGDAVQFLNETEERFDLFVAADVLAYQGDLRPLFAAIRNRALSGGTFAFSTEACRGGEWKLRRSGRFAHSWAYVKEVANENGFAVEWRQRTGIRKENGGWIEGDLAILRIVG